MNSQCQNVTKHLIDITDGGIPESSKNAILHHIATCPRCDRLVKEFTRIWQDLSKAGKRAPSDNFWPGLLAKIEALEKPRPLREKMLAGLRISFRTAAVGLLLSFGVYFGYQLGNTPPVETTRWDISHLEQYIQDFHDFPEGSVSDFYTQFNIQKEQKAP